MKITIFGAAGDVGRRMTAEALSRGHDVTAVLRDAARASELPVGAVVRVGDAMDAEAVAGLLEGQDVAISALRPASGREELLVTLTRAVLHGAARAGARALIVGGAASLRLDGDGGDTVLTAPGFLPDAVLPIAAACYAQYVLCMQEGRADWTYLCPPAMLRPGARTGRYRVGSDRLLTDAAGQSRISMEDFAVAMLDEVETPRHTRARFTVAD